jgi:hypothetical protein
MGLLGNIFRKKVQAVTAPDPNTSIILPVIRAPLGLVPGSVWHPSDVDIGLAQADGSIIQVPQGDQIVSHLGMIHLFGMDVYNIYLQGSENFLQVVTQAAKMDQVRQCRLFTLHKDVLVSTQDDVEFWLGKIGRDAHGMVIRDKWGNSEIIEPGLIGWPQFQIDGPPALVYDRQWATTKDAPVQFKEQIRYVNTSSIIAYEAMEYARLTSDVNSIVEHLLVTFQGATGTVKVYVGVDLDPATQNVISVA